MLLKFDTSEDEEEEEEEEFDVNSKMMHSFAHDSLQASSLITQTYKQMRSAPCGMRHVETNILLLRSMVKDIRG